RVAIVAAQIFLSFFLRRLRRATLLRLFGSVHDNGRALGVDWRTIRGLHRDTIGTGRRRAARALPAIEEDTEADDHRQCGQSGQDFVRISSEFVTKNPNEPDAVTFCHSALSRTSAMGTHKIFIVSD